MTWLSSLSAALLSGVAGLFLAGFIANACVSWYHVSSREGASGFYVIFMSIGGGIAGLIIGLIAARIAVAQLGAGFGKELGAALNVVLLIGGISALLARVFADVPPEIDGRDLILEVEFRFPNTHRGDKPPTAEGEWDYSFASLSGNTCRKRDYGTILTEAARFENGQWIVPTTVSLFTERGDRSVSIAPRNAKESFGFLLPIPRRPGKELLEWSAWFPLQQADGKPWPTDKMSCRYRLQKTAPPPPPKSNEELQVEKNAEEEAEFNAIPADAPIEAWFRYTAYQQPLTGRALQAIASRTNHVSELNALMVDADSGKAHAAMICVSQLSAPAKELIPGVAAAGRLIATNITKFNNTPKEQDPDFATAVDPATRFYGWIPAAKSLREKCGADLTPELKTILELSRVRPESTCMRRDICRVASYYLHQWAGIEPLPSDPKPK
ncbi:MAG: hypothetical protein IPK15_25005 [Verrucomicrobia bacterium]|nr:hypothetical protein [Verrucomicrobiota bacterium]